MGIIRCALPSLVGIYVGKLADARGLTTSNPQHISCIVNCSPTPLRLPQVVELVVPFKPDITCLEHITLCLRCSLAVGPTLLCVTDAASGTAILTQYLVEQGMALETAVGLVGTRFGGWTLMLQDSKHV